MQRPASDAGEGVPEVAVEEPLVLVVHQVARVRQVGGGDLALEPGDRDVPLLHAHRGLGRRQRLVLQRLQLALALGGGVGHALQRHRAQHRERGEPTDHGQPARSAAEPDRLSARAEPAPAPPPSPRPSALARAAGAQARAALRSGLADVHERADARLHAREVVLELVEDRVRVLDLLLLGGDQLLDVRDQLLGDDDAGLGDLDLLGGDRHRQPGLALLRLRREQVEVRLLHLAEVGEVVVLCGLRAGRPALRGADERLVAEARDRLVVVAVEVEARGQLLQREPGPVELVAPARVLDQTEPRERELGASEGR